MGFVLTEAELDYHYGSELSHYGVKGMRWGKSGAGKSGGPSSTPSRKELRSLDKVAKKEIKVEKRADSDKRDAEILKKREGLQAQYDKYNAADAQYKIDKKTIGKVAAKKILNQAADEVNKAYEEAMQPTRREANQQAVNSLMFAVGATATSALLKS